MQHWFLLLVLSLDGTVWAVPVSRTHDNQTTVLAATEQVTQENITATTMNERCCNVTTTTAVSTSLSSSHVTQHGLTTEGLARRWEKLESRVRGMVSGAMEQLMPMMLRASFELDISSSCISSLLQLVQGINEMKLWALTMLDSSAKPIAGLLQSSLTSMGAYDACVQLVVRAERGRNVGQERFRGQYCSVQFRPPLPKKPHFYTIYESLEVLKNISKGTVFGYIAREAQVFYVVPVRYGVCVPSTCNQQDIANMASFVAKDLELDVEVPRCEVKEELRINSTQIAAITCLSVLLLVVAVGTAMDVLPRIFNSNEWYLGEGKSAKCHLARMVLCFSAYTNFLKLINTRQDKQTLGAIHGMRVFGMSWIIICHTYYFVNYHGLVHLIAVRDMASGFWFQVLANGTVAVDTFFFISGLLVSYGLLKAVGEQRTFNVPKFISHRIIRLLPSHMFILACTLLLPLIGSGPLWHETLDPWAENCQQHWWTNLLFVNNLVGLHKECLSHTWYLAADFQLYLASVLILLPLLRWPVVGHVLYVLLAAGSMIATGLVTYLNHLPPTLLMVHPDTDQVQDFRTFFYGKPYPHAGAYCVGLAAGVLLAKRPKLSIFLYFRILGWLLAALCNFSILFGAYNWNKGHLPSATLGAIYAATHRTAWAIGVAWVTVICCRGLGGIVNSILSWKAFTPLSRMTFMAYLIHPLLQVTYMGLLRAPIHLNEYVMVYLYLGHLVLTFFLAAVASVLVEGPFLALSKIVFGGVRPYAKTAEPQMAPTSVELPQQLPVSLLSSKNTNGCSPCEESFKHG